MTDKPILLDLFCKAGGAARGYADVGFQVIGVDIEPQAHYPYPFYRGDAFRLLPRLMARYDVAAIHASPPCQAYSRVTNLSGRPREDYPDLLEPTRKLLKDSELPYIMENVEGAPVEDPVSLCGTMFGLGADWDGEWHQLRRHRLFESNVLMHQPSPCKHAGGVINVYGNPGGTDKRRGKKLAGVGEWAAAMQIDWMNGYELAQAIPPAFTCFLGAQVMAQMDVVV